MNEETNQMLVVEDSPRGIQAAPRVTGSTPADLIRYAMESGADLDRLERLMEMQIKWESREAEKAFAEAMAAFSENPPRVFKDKHVDFKTASGRTQYDHATIGNATDIIKAALAVHGFSHRWVTTQPDGKVRVECIITHRMGHSQSNSLESSPDASGGKNSIQAIISARTYLERHTLFDATGCAPLDEKDDDGAGTDLKTELADEWIAKVNACKTDDEVVKVWDLGSPVLEKLPNSYDEFKIAVVEARRKIAKGGAA